MEEIAGNELAIEKREQAMLELADFDEVVRVYRPRILRFLLSSLTDRDAAETLTQEMLSEGVGRAPAVSRRLQPEHLADAHRRQPDARSPAQPQPALLAEDPRLCAGCDGHQRLGSRRAQLAGKPGDGA